MLPATDFQFRGAMTPGGSLPSRASAGWPACRSSPESFAAGCCSPWAPVNTQYQSSDPLWLMTTDPQLGCNKQQANEPLTAAIKALEEWTVPRRLMNHMITFRKNESICKIHSPGTWLDNVFSTFKQKQSVYLTSSANKIPIAHLELKRNTEQGLVFLNWSSEQSQQKGKVQRISMSAHPHTWLSVIDFVLY